MRAAIGHSTQQRDSAVDRVAAAASGVAYAGLSVTAVKILGGARSGGGAASSPRATAGGVLAWTGGTPYVTTAHRAKLSEALRDCYARAASEVGHRAKLVAQTQSRAP